MCGTTKGSCWLGAAFSRCRPRRHRIRSDISNHRLGVDVLKSSVLVFLCASARISPAFRSSLHRRFALRTYRLCIFTAACAPPSVRSANMLFAHFDTFLPSLIPSARPRPSSSGLGTAEVGSSSAHASTSPACGPVTCRGWSRLAAPVQDVAAAPVCRPSRPPPPPTYSITIVRPATTVRTHTHAR